MSAGYRTFGVTGRVKDELSIFSARLVLVDEYGRERTIALEEPSLFASPGDRLTAIYAARGEDREGKLLRLINRSNGKERLFEDRLYSLRGRRLFRALPVAIVWTLIFALAFAVFCQINGNPIDTHIEFQVMAATVGMSFLAFLILFWICRDVATHSIDRLIKDGCEREIQSQRINEILAPGE
ncbi:MAG: hypothetical protein HXY22_03165 [Alphaproteobacteria bacterium]|nr:hypothetical protein [Alphaproteobacteria bacterium]